MPDCGCPMPLFSCSSLKLVSEDGELRVGGISDNQTINNSFGPVKIFCHGSLGVFTLMF